MDEIKLRFHNIISVFLIENTHFSFYKNIVYKNIESHFMPNLKNILIAQIVVDIEMFL